MRLRDLVLGVLLLLLAGCATAPHLPQPGAGEEALPELCRKYDMDCSFDSVSQTVNMMYKAKRIRALVGSTVVVVSGEQVSLSAPLKRVKGVVVVPVDFEDRVMGRLLATEKNTVTSFPKWIGKVVIDPGHGGNDPGAIGAGNLKEKDIVLDIGRKIRDGLVRSGVEVLMTRDKDEYPTLEKRTEIASTPGTEIFVSVHVNSVRENGKGRRNTSAQGVEVYYIGPLSSKDLSDRQRRLNENSIIAAFAMDHSSSDLKRIVLDMLYAHKLTASPRLSLQVSGAISRGIRDTRRRGCKMARFAVLRNTLVPAVLIEVGFLTNPREARLLKDSAYRQKMADAIVNSITGYLYDSKQ